MNRRRPWWSVVVPAICGAMVAATMAVRPVLGQSPTPPPDLTKLERQVALKIAHVRIKGPSNSADLKQLGLAQRAQLDGEKALTAGDYQKAEQDFLRANVIITGISE